jgi:trehalose 6-phosphate phosphatase
VPLTSLDPQKIAILLDIDGTLLDIAPTPHSVHVPSSLRKTLQQLQQLGGGALALVSGRTLADIDLLFAPAQFTTIGGHGAEMRLMYNGTTHHRGATTLDPTLRSRLAEIVKLGNGIILEDKGYSVAIHYRLAPDKERAVYDAVEAIKADLPSLDVLSGKAVVEIKNLCFDKGTAIRDLMQHPPFAGRQPVFVGDDKTDEAAFKVLPEFNGIAISVGRMVPGVATRFEAPSDVRRWLEDLCKKNSRARQHSEAQL